MRDEGVGWGINTKGELEFALESVNAAGVSFACARIEFDLQRGPR